MALTEGPTDYTLLAVTAPGFVKELQDFSLVLGGPIFQLFRRSHLTGGHLEFLYRRLLIITPITWLPLLLLSTLSSSAAYNGQLAFLHDIEVLVRFLIALPILIVAELIVHSRIRPIVRAFIERRIISPHDLSRFQSVIESAMRTRDSIAMEVGLLLFVYTFGLWRWQSRAAINAPTWYSMTGGGWHLTPAGLWYVFVSIPIFQFFLLRWYMRLFIWFRLLWHISRINLHLVPTHPDRSAGLAFLGQSTYAFAPILFAQGAMLAGVLARRVVYGGESLASFKFQIAGFVSFFVLVILGPLIMFAPQMARAKRKGLAEYGLLAERYVEQFEEKWIRDSASSEELLGAADIQSLADLGNSYALVREMRAVPFGLNEISRLAVVTAVPLLPLLLTMFSPEELIIRVIKTLF
jgi:hypothetical protein